ncbi:hypothetical protein BT69DRAFT_415282 [Atractiella rhizophila]|nr:hypothetical protein BT69DRAFT_415282 [Atractiella rhizophila]
MDEITRHSGRVGIELREVLRMLNKEIRDDSGYGSKVVPSSDSPGPHTHLSKTFDFWLSSQKHVQIIFTFPLDWVAPYFYFLNFTWSASEFVLQRDNVSFWSNRDRYCNFLLMVQTAYRSTSQAPRIVCMKPFPMCDRKRVYNANNNCYILG